MNIVEHVSLLHVGASSGYMPRSGIAENSGQILEKEEHSSIAGETPSWYNHVENQSGGSSENFT